ncbi:sigma-70 family RNA polymerase sigma factor [Streptomyces hypolithicus]
MEREAEAPVVAAAAAGDGEARQLLLAAHLPLVYNVVGRALRGHTDVDDVVQETMLRALNGLDGLRDPEAFRSWLMAIAMNQVRRHRSAGARPPADALERVREVADPAADFVELTIWRLGLSGQRREVAEATRWLDADDRELLALWWLEAAGEITRRELAGALEIAPRHAAVRVQRMKEQLEAGRLVVRSLAAVPGCAGLQPLTALWDGGPSALWRKRIARHARDCATCAGRSGDLVPAEGLLARLSLVPLPLSLSAPDALDAHATASTGLVAASPPPPVSPGGAPPPPVSPGGAPPPPTARRPGPRTAGAVAAVVVAAAAVALWPWGAAEAPSAPAPGGARPQQSASASVSVSVRPPQEPSADATPSGTAPTRAPEPPPPTTPTPAPPATRAPAPAPAGIEQQVTDLVNARRARSGCPPVRPDPKLHAAAQRHADDMSARGYFAHTGPGGADPGARITAAGYAWSAWAENIHRGPTTVDATVAGWMSDTAHRNNILDCRFTHMGIGRSSGPGGPWWTQDFAAR